MGFQLLNVDFQGLEIWAFAFGIRALVGDNLGSVGKKLIRDGISDILEWVEWVELIRDRVSSALEWVVRIFSSILFSILYIWESVLVNLIYKWFLFLKKKEGVFWYKRYIFYKKRKFDNLKTEIELEIFSRKSWIDYSRGYWYTGL